MTSEERNSIWERLRLKSLKYESLQPSPENFISVTLPRSVLERMEEIRDSKELDRDMWAVIAGILDIFANEFEKEQKAES